MKKKKKLRNVSASQVKTFQRCNKKWYFEKIEGKRGPSTNAQRRGTAIHHALEIYAQSGKVLKSVWVDETTGNIVTEGGVEYPVERFVKALKEIVDEMDIVGLEKPIRLPTFEDGPPWIGYIDVLARDKVIDYKTTSDLRYAKTPEDLLDDPQACSYVKSVFDQYPELEDFDVQFIYLKTSNKKKVNVRVVTANFSRADCEKVYQEAVDTVRNMVHTAKVDSVADVEGNSDACMDFGGCPHKKYCDVKRKWPSSKTKGMTGKRKPTIFSNPELFRKKKK